MESKVRTRFAPSPTGNLHIGNARTAIMNWFFARHHHAVFVLRIEDTDRERSMEKYEKAILDDLKWLGIDWDEGPTVGGKFGPYRQSERLGLYQQYLHHLIEEGTVYPCYCTAEELEMRRKGMIARGESAHYDGRCRNLSAENKQQLEKSGRKPAYRFHVEGKNIDFDDLVKGPISFVGENIGDFILVRADGRPMYNFACVVDDHTMDISHIIRGDDHVSNTARQLLVYNAFNWTPPAFAHIPMILGRDRIRLSKRHGATSVSKYRELGYLPDALINFLSLLSLSNHKTTY